MTAETVNVNGIEMGYVVPGVMADVHVMPTGIYIPLVFSDEPSSGKVGAWLDALPKDQRIVFPTVISARLEGMLIRRGYHVEQEWAEQFGEYVVCYVRDAEATP